MKLKFKYWYIIIIMFFLVACGVSTSTNTESQVSVKATINLASLPDNFLYDLDSSQNGTPEYEWGITFDINNDSIINEGDITLRVILIAWDNNQQTTIGRAELPATLWAWEAGSGTSYFTRKIADIELETTETSLTFIAPVDMYNSLGSITNGTQIYVKTQYKNQTSGVFYYDYYPADSTYSVGIDTGMIEDSIIDFETNSGPVSGVDYPLIDITSVTVVVE